MPMKLFTDAVTHNGVRCSVEYHESDDFQHIPDALIQKVHAVCFYEDKLLLVGYSNFDIWGIPGGTREPGESIEETLLREILEETNCEVVDLAPLGYQKVIAPDGDVHYRMQYFCNVKPRGDFESDVAGFVNKIIWINPADYKDHIEQKEFRQIVLQSALDKYQGFSA